MGLPAAGQVGGLGPPPQDPGETSSLSTVTAAGDFGDIQFPYPTGDLSVDLFDDYDWSTMFQDESFADLGQASLADVAYSFHYPSAPGISNQIGLAPTRRDLPPVQAQNVPRPDVAVTERADLSAFTSRLPSLEPDEQGEAFQLKDDQNVRTPSWTTQNPRRCFLEVTHECRQRLLLDMADFNNVVLDDFMMPSKHALNRFVYIYIASFYEHNPVLHLPTVSLETMAVELFLAIACIGAHYCGEIDTSSKLCQVARDMAFERLRRVDSAIPVTSQARDATDQAKAAGPGEWSVAQGLVPRGQIETMQAFVLLFGFSIWHRKNPGTNSRSMALIRSTLESLIRDVALNAAKIQRNDNWHSWVQAETLKRIVLVSFCLFNLQSLIHEIPPPLLWTEINMCLPCTEGRWNAISSTAWASSSEQELEEATVQATLHHLFHDGSDGRQPTFSSLGGYFLIHAILQHMWILQKTRLLENPTSKMKETDDFWQFQRALRQWRRGWANDRESSMSPVNPFGPIAFTSTALLRLAYVRLNFSARLIPLLDAWSPEKIAQVFIQAPAVERNDRTTRAALHCAHALSIPVKIGLKFVARTQGFYWSIQHAVSSLECALFLCKWLESVTSPDVETPLTQQEMLVIDFIVSIVAETDLRAPKEVLLQTRRLLSRTVVRIWARLFPGDSAWEMVDLIGSSMRACADALGTR